MDYEDFYYEPSESDVAINELKKHLRNEVKNEIISELEYLKKENQELQDIKNNKDKYEKEYKNKLLELEQDYKEKERTLYKRPIQDLLEIIQEEYYYVSYDMLEKEKCNKCNDDRKIELIDAYKRKHYVNCVCSERYKSDWLVKTKYIGVITEISKRENKLKMWVSFSYSKCSCERDGYYVSGIYFDKNSIIYDFDEFIIKNKDKIQESIDKGYYLTDYIFSKREDAQRFANYLNKLTKE